MLKVTGKNPVKFTVLVFSEYQLKYTLINYFL
jgi:hypothetical protein